MLIAVGIESLPRPLGQQPRAFLRKLASGSIIGVLERIYSLADVTAAGGRDKTQNAVRTFLGPAVFTVQDIERAAKHRQKLRRSDRLELEHGRSRKQSAVYGEIRVLGSRADKDYPSVLDVFQQTLLLFFVEILYFVYVKEYPAGGKNRIRVAEHIAHVRKRRGGRVYAEHLPIGHLRGYGSKRGLPGAGRAVKHERRDMSALEQPAKRSAGSEQMLLSGYFVY